jgi:hypothetical protein
MKPFALHEVLQASGLLPIVTYHPSSKCLKIEQDIGDSTTTRKNSWRKVKGIFEGSAIHRVPRPDFSVSPQMTLPLAAKLKCHAASLSICIQTCFIALQPRSLGISNLTAHENTPGVD